jgi:hypothetical protein
MEVLWCLCLALPHTPLWPEASSTNKAGINFLVEKDTCPGVQIFQDNGIDLLQRKMKYSMPF